MSGDKKSDSLASLFMELKQANEVLSPAEIAGEIVEALGESTATIISNQLVLKVTKA